MATLNMYSARKRAQEIAAKEPEKLLGFLYQNKNVCFDTTTKVSFILKSIHNPHFNPGVNNNPELKQFVSIFGLKTLGDIIQNSNTYSTQVSSMIQDLEPFLYKGARNVVVKMFLDNIDKFYLYACKNAANSCTRIVLPKTRLATDLFLATYKKLDVDSLDTIIPKLLSDYRSKEVNKVLKTSRYLTHLQFSESDLSNPDSRKKLISKLAESPTICRNLKFPVQVTFDDLMELPSVKRIEFSEHLYSDMFKATRRLKDKRITVLADTSFQDCLDEINKFEHQTTGLVEPTILTIDELKKLMFSVSLKKNNRLNAFFRNYERMLEAMGS